MRRHNDHQPNFHPSRFSAGWVMAALFVLITLDGAPSMAQGREAVVVIGVSRFDIKRMPGGKFKVAPGRGLTWTFRPGESKTAPWVREEMVDPDSEVIHRAVWVDLDGSGKKRLLTAGANRAVLKLYRDPKLRQHPQILWNPVFTKKRSRLRDFRVADIDGDGRPEIIVGTHPKGVVAVLKKTGERWEARELSREDRTWIHEIAVGRVSAPSGPPDFFATFSQPNVVPGKPQLGRIVRWRWDGKGFRASVVESFDRAHAKEITVGDVDGDGRPELVASIEGVSRRYKEGGRVRVKLVEPARVKVYRRRAGKWIAEEIATVPDVSLRSLAVGDADNDGRPDIVLGPRRAGLRILRLRDGAWRQSVIDRRTAGINLPVLIADLDGDGRNEVLAASDFTGQILRYDWTGSGWKRSVFATIPKEHWTWSMEVVR